MIGRKWMIVSSGLVALAGACKGEAPATKIEPEAEPAEAATKIASAEVVAPSTTEAPPAEPPPSGHAVAKVGSLLFLSSTGDVGFELPPMGPAAGMTVVVVGEQDGRLVVETLAPKSAAHHCAATLDGLADFRLRLHLTKADLLPVLTEELLHEASDGTKLRIARGVPVPAGSRELDVRGTPVHVPVPAESLGRFYQPGPAFAEDGNLGMLYALEGHPLTYEGRTLDETNLYGRSGDVLTYGTVERVGDALVTVRNPCIEATVLASLDRLRSSPPAGSGVTGYMEQPSSSPYREAELVASGATGADPTTKVFAVRSGTAIVWVDGRPAGQVTADHAFAKAPRADSGRSCFDAPLVEGQATTVTLCFDPGDVDELAVPAMPVDAPVGVGSVPDEPTAPMGLLSPPAGEGKPGLEHGLGSKPGPKPKPSKSKPAGSLDKDIIRRVVRAHMREVRACYERGLARNPSLSGKVSIQFTIGTTGSVDASKVASSTLADESVAQCIAKAVERWTFPKPTGGEVVVTYPFVLASAE